jgi:glycosyltransferase involved in cell wall biosynthesis
MPMKTPNKNKKILLITQMYPSGRTGTSVKTRNTIEFLQKKGFFIDVCCLHHASMIKNELSLPNVRVFFVERDIISRLTPTFALRVFSVLFSSLPFRVKKTFDRKLNVLISTLLTSTEYDYVFFDGFSTLQYATGFDKKNIYIDDEDISDLMMRRFKETKNPILKLFFLLEYYKCKNYERKYLNYMSQIWAICKNSAIHLALSTKRPIKVMPTPVQEQKNFFSPRSKDIVFTGLLSWMENINGLKWFLENCWDEILAQHKNTKLYVIGQRAEQPFIDYLQSYKNVVYLGYVERLEDVYKKCAMAIAPLLINCGIKVKVVTYLSYGLPVVGLPESVWGMNESKGVVIALADEFAQKTNSLLSNDQLRAKLSKEALQNIQKNHSQKALQTFFEKVRIL